MNKYICIYTHIAPTTFSNKNSKWCFALFWSRLARGTNNHFEIYAGICWLRENCKNLKWLFVVCPG